MEELGPVAMHMCGYSPVFEKLDYWPEVVAQEMHLTDRSDWSPKVNCGH